MYITNYTLIRQLINVNSKYEFYMMLHRKYLCIILIDILLKFTKTNANVYLKYDSMNFSFFTEPLHNFLGKI